MASFTWPDNESGGGGSGTVTSVGLSAPPIFVVSGSPVTTSGTLAITLATESANTIWAGPVSGSAATPTFRALVAADIPAVSPSGAAGGDLSGTYPNPSVATVGGSSAASINAAAVAVAAAAVADTPSTLVLRDSSGTIYTNSIHMNASMSSFIYAANSSISISNEILTDYTGYNTVDWGNQYLNSVTSSGKTTVDWGDELLIDGNGGNNTVVDWGNQYLWESTGQNVTVDWTNQMLQNVADDQVTVDWGNRYLYSYPFNNQITVDWGAGALYDPATGNSAMLWGGLSGLALFPYGIGIEAGITLHSFPTLTGVATLSGGIVTVSNTNITSTSVVFVTVQTPGGTVGAPFISNYSPGTGFTIKSTSTLDTSAIQWIIFTIP
jgi:hypothetical protein